jgi:hypothetical protein
MSEESELFIHQLQSELTQVIVEIGKQYTDITSQQQMADYLEVLIESLKYFHERGNYGRMAYDIYKAIDFLPSAFPIK